MVCPANPRNNKPPSSSPLRRVRRSIVAIFFLKINASMTVAIQNRSAMKSIGVQSARLDFTTTNVLPQIKVVMNKADSPVRRFRCRSIADCTYAFHVPDSLAAYWSKSLPHSVSRLHRSYTRRSMNGHLYTS